MRSVPVFSCALFFMTILLTVFVHGFFLRLFLTDVSEVLATLISFEIPFTPSISLAT